MLFFYNACFCDANQRKNRIKMVVPEEVETRDTIKFCIKCGYKPPEMLCFLLQIGGDALEMKKYKVSVPHMV